MAITKAQIKAALANYLPDTINTVVDSKTGEVNEAEVFERILQVISTSFVTDKQTVYYLIALSIGRLDKELKAAETLIDKLVGDSQLRGVSPKSAEAVTDLSLLDKARVDLLNLSGRITGGDDFGTQHFADFKTSITSFLDTELKDNLAGRNTPAIVKDLRASMAALDDAWSTITSKRAQVFKVLTEFQSVDLKALAALKTIVAIERKISEIQDQLSFANSTQQAQLAESIMLELSAGYAALKIIGDAPVASGTQLMGISELGKINPTYLEAIGEGHTVPTQYILKGSFGSPYVDYSFADATGSSSATADQPKAKITFVSSSGGTGVYDFSAITGTTVKIYLRINGYDRQGEELCYVSVDVAGIGGASKSGTTLIATSAVTVSAAVGTSGAALIANSSGELVLESTADAKWGDSGSTGDFPKSNSIEILSCDNEPLLALFGIADLPINRAITGTSSFDLGYSPATSVKDQYLLLLKTGSSHRITDHTPGSPNVTLSPRVEPGLSSERWIITGNKFGTLFWNKGEVMHRFPTAAGGSEAVPDFFKWPPSGKTVDTRPYKLADPMEFSATRGSTFSGTGTQGKFVPIIKVDNTTTGKGWSNVKCHGAATVAPKKMGTVGTQMSSGNRNGLVPGGYKNPTISNKFLTIPSYQIGSHRRRQDLSSHSESDGSFNSGTGWLYPPCGYVSTTLPYMGKWFDDIPGLTVDYYDGEDSPSGTSGGGSLPYCWGICTLSVATAGASKMRVTTKDASGVDIKLSNFGVKVGDYIDIFENYSGGFSQNMPSVSIDLNTSAGTIAMKGNRTWRIGALGANYVDLLAADPDRRREGRRTGIDGTIGGVSWNDFLGGGQNSSTQWKYRIVNSNFYDPYGAFITRGVQPGDTLIAWTRSNDRFGWTGMYKLSNLSWASAAPRGYIDLIKDYNSAQYGWEACPYAIKVGAWEIVEVVSETELDLKTTGVTDLFDSTGNGAYTPDIPWGDFRHGNAHLTYSRRVELVSGNSFTLEYGILSFNNKVSYTDSSGAEAEADDLQRFELSAYCDGQNIWPQRVQDAEFEPRDVEQLGFMSSGVVPGDYILVAQDEYDFYSGSAWEIVHVESDTILYVKDSQGRRIKLGTEDLHQLGLSAGTATSGTFGNDWGGAESRIVRPAYSESATASTRKWEYRRRSIIPQVRSATFLVYDINYQKLMEVRNPAYDWPTDSDRNDYTDQNGSDVDFTLGGVVEGDVVHFYNIHATEPGGHEDLLYPNFTMTVDEVRSGSMLKMTQEFTGASTRGLLEDEDYTTSSHMRDQISGSGEETLSAFGGSSGWVDDSTTLFRASTKFFRILLPSNKVHLPNSYLEARGVVAGDKLILKSTSGAGKEAVFSITAITDTHYVTVSPALDAPVDASGNPITGIWYNFRFVDASTDAEYEDIYGSGYTSLYEGGLGWRIESGETDTDGNVITNIFHQGDGIDLESIDGLSVGSVTDISPTYDWSDEPDTSIESEDKPTFVKTASGSVGTIKDLKVAHLGDAGGFYSKTSYLTITEKVPVRASNEDWSIYAGERTRAVYASDRTESTLTDMGSPGDLLVLGPGTDLEERTSIKEIRKTGDTGYSHSFWESATTVEADRSGLTWATLPKDYPWPGNEIIVSEGRYTISDVKRLSNAGDYTTPSYATVLEVYPTLPMNMGQDNNFFIVHPGVDPFTTFFEDDDPKDHLGASTTFTTIAGDKKGLEGKAIEIYGKPPIFATVKSVISPTRIELSTRYPVRGEKSPYRIVTEDLGRSRTLDVSLDAPDTSEFTATTAAITDSLKPRLTIWTNPDVLSVSSVDETSNKVEFYPAVESDQEGLAYAVTDTEGSKDYGRYLLLNYFNNKLTLDANIESLKLRVAEVIHKKGVDRALVLKNSHSGEDHDIYVGPVDDPTSHDYNDIVPEDLDSDVSGHFYLGEGNAENTSIYDESGTKKDDLQEVAVGDQLTIKVQYETKTGGTVVTSTKFHRSFVTEVRPARTPAKGHILDLTVSPKLPVTKLFNTTDREAPADDGDYRALLVDWAIHRSSISYAINEAMSLKQQILDLRSLVKNYTVDSSPVVDSVLKLLEEKGMDRARDLLIDGEIENFFDLTYQDASYAGAAKTAIQSTGKTLIQSDDS